MREVLGVQVEKNDKGKMTLKFWGCFNLPAKHAGFVIVILGTAVYYFF